MAAELSIPADIFEEMAGMKEITPPPSPTGEQNVNSERIVTPIDEARLKVASRAFFSKIEKKFVKTLNKVAKKLLSYQKQDAPPKIKRPKNILVKIIINESPAETEGRENAKDAKKNESILTKAWKAFKFILKKLLGFVVKHLVKKAIKIILAAMKKMLKAVKKAVKVAFRVFKRTIKKIAKWIFKSVKALVKVIWKLIKKLFFRGKASAKHFTGEPNNKDMGDPSLSRKKNKMGLKMKGIKKKESFIMKALKKLFKKIVKPLQKLITKVFKKIIMKIIKTIVKMIVKFIAMQVIGSLLPGIGNAIMGAASMALMVMDIIGIVNFVQGISRDVTSLADEVEPDADEGDGPDDDGPDFDEMSMQEVQAFMKNLEQQGQTASDDYYDAKARYLELLAEQYEKEGDIEGLELIEQAMETGRVPTEGAPEHNGPEDPDAIKKLDISALQKELQRRKEAQAKRKYENKRKNVFDESEMNILLKGEEDGGPMWMSIWREIMWFTKQGIWDRYWVEPERFNKICYEELGSNIVPRKYTYTNEPQWWYETKEQRDERVEKGRNKILNEENSEYSEKEELKDQLKFDEVIDKVDKYKFNTMEVSFQYRKEKINEINAQRTKHNKLLEALTIILDKRGLSTANMPHRPYLMSVGPTK